MDAELILAGKSYALSLEKPEGSISVKVGEKSLRAEITRLAPNCLSITLGDQQRIAFTARSDEGVFVHVAGHVFQFEEGGAKAKAFVGGPGAVGSGSVSSPMPGRVVKIPVKEGQDVKKNQVLVIVEAMKMENPLRSSVAGKVKKVHYAEGDLVDAGMPIVEVDAGQEANT
jgi:biotin carboxyl carrier protein